MPLRLMLMRWRVHPGDRTLISLKDGEIRERKRTRVIRHLESCPRCQLRSKEITWEWGVMEQANSSQDVSPELTAAVLSYIRAWRAGQMPGSVSGTAEPLDQAEAARRIAAVLEIYLGKRAAEALLRSDGELTASGQDGLTNARSTLRILLGEKTAAAVETKIMSILGRVPRSADGSSLL